MSYSIDIATPDELRVAISGDIDHHTAAPMREGIDAEIERLFPARLILDLGEVTFMDSSGIGLVMGRYRLMQPYGGTIEIINVPKALRRVFKIAGLCDLASIEEEGGRVNAT